MVHKIICIGRQFGSGGHEIAVRTGAKLGIRVYERDILHLACKYGELAVKTLEKADETATNPFLFQGVYEGTSTLSGDCPPQRCSLPFRAMKYAAWQVRRTVSS